MGTALGAGQSAPVEHHGWLPAVAVGLTLAAVLLAWLEFGRRQSAQIGFVERMPALAALFGQRWYIDHFYRHFLDKVVYRGISGVCTWNDRRVIDGALDGLGGSTVGLGDFAARLHTGLFQHRLMVMFAVVVVLVLYFGLGAL